MKTKYECTHCNDTGWYKACCRDHICSCEAGEREERELRTKYGGYQTDGINTGYTPIVKTR